MCAGVKWLPSSVAVFRDLCLHLGDFIIVAMATTSGMCFWDSAHVVKHKWLYVVVSCCVFTVKQKKSISEYCVSHWLNKCDGDHSISSDRDRNYRDGPGMDTPDDTGIAVRVYTMFLESLPLTLWLRFEEFQGKYPLPISYIGGNMEFGIWIPFLLYLKILYWDEVTILSQSLIVTTRLGARS